MRIENMISLIEGDYCRNVYTIVSGEMGNFFVLRKKLNMSNIEILSVHNDDLVYDKIKLTCYSDFIKDYTEIKS